MLKRAVLVGLVWAIVFITLVSLLCDYDFRGTWVRECNETTNGTWIIEKHFRRLTCFGQTWLFEDLSLRKVEFTPKCEMGTAERKLGWLTVRATTWWEEKSGLVPVYPVCDYTVAILGPSGQEGTYRPISGTNVTTIPITEEGVHVISFLTSSGNRICEGQFYLDPAKGWSWGCSSGAWFAPWPEEGK